MVTFSRLQTYPREATGPTGHLWATAPCSLLTSQAPAWQGTTLFQSLVTTSPAWLRSTVWRVTEGFPVPPFPPLMHSSAPLQVPGGAGAGETEEEQHWYSSAWAFRHRSTTLAPTSENQGKISIPHLPYHTSTWQLCPTTRAELEWTGKALPGRGDK